MENLTLKEVLSEITNNDIFREGIKFYDVNDVGLLDIKALLDCCENETNYCFYGEISKLNIWDWCGNIIHMKVHGKIINMIKWKKFTEEEMVYNTSSDD